MEFDLNKSLEVLERTPRVVDSLTRNLSDGWTHSDYGKSTWSVHQIVGHLIWGERTDWIPRAVRIMESGESVPFEPFDRNGHAELCQHHSLHELLEMFARERKENLSQLRKWSLTTEQLARRGRHPALGVASLAQLLATWVVHDLNHVAQISKAMAFQYSSAVGPWEQYLSILAPPNPR